MLTLQNKKQSESPASAKLSWQGRTLSVVILLIWALACAVHPYWPAIVLSVCALVGILFCFSIVIHLVGKNNAITRQFCVTEGKFNCDEVLEKGKLGKNFSIADIGLIFFSAEFIFLSGSSAFQSVDKALSLLLIPVNLAAVGSVALIVWQAFFIRQWCKMCLLVTAVLWLQAVVVGISAHRSLPILTLNCRDFFET